MHITTLTELREELDALDTERAAPDAQLFFEDEDGRVYRLMRLEDDDVTQSDGRTVTVITGILEKQEPINRLADMQTQGTA